MWPAPRLGVLPLWPALCGGRANGARRWRILGAAAHLTTRAGGPGRVVLLPLIRGSLRLGAALSRFVRRGRAAHPHGWPARRLGCARASARGIAVLPSSISQLIGGALAIGISGSRRPAPVSLAALAALVAQLPADVPVLVGDAPGVDRRASELLPQARVFHVASYGAGSGAFAARSIACVQACASARGVWCAFPAGPAPAGLRPSARSSACFAGFGSGTWASLAFALGLGLPAVVYLLANVSAPAGWALVAVGDGWHMFEPPTQYAFL